MFQRVRNIYGKLQVSWQSNGIELHCNCHTLDACYLRLNIIYCLYPQVTVIAVHESGFRENWVMSWSLIDSSRSIYVICDITQEYLNAQQHSNRVDSTILPFRATSSWLNPSLRTWVKRYRWIDIPMFLSWNLLRIPMETYGSSALLTFHTVQVAVMYKEYQRNLIMD